MPFCPRCGKDVLATDVYCPNCGQSVNTWSTASSSPIPATPVFRPTQAPAGAATKSPAGAALLNFFLPGVGYIYVGIGRGAWEIVFGLIVFLAYVIGIDVSFAANILIYTPSPSSAAPVSPYSYLLFLVFLFPFAFAYDGYHRAMKTRQ